MAAPVRRQATLYVIFGQVCQMAAPEGTLAISNCILLDIVMEAISGEFRDAFIDQLLYAVDLVVIAESEDELINSLIIERMVWRVMVCK